MKILVSPSIKEPYKNQVEYSFDKKWFSFLNNIFDNIELVLPEKCDDKLDLIILTGGNDLVFNNPIKRNIMRQKQDKKLYNLALINNIPLIGICFGAQFIAYKLNCKIKKIDGHIGNHLVKTCNQDSLLVNYRKKFLVNSYHNMGIIDQSKKIIALATAEDNSIELFKAKNKKILGMMWHPERFSKIRKVDKDIFTTFYNQK